VRAPEKSLSISGDGGFLFRRVEWENGRAPQAKIVHIVWIEARYDMLPVQEKLKYVRISGGHRTSVHD